MTINEMLSPRWMNKLVGCFAFLFHSKSTKETEKEELKYFFHNYNVGAGQFYSAGCSSSRQCGCGLRELLVLDWSCLSFGVHHSLQHSLHLLAYVPES